MWKEGNQKTFGKSVLSILLIGTLEQLRKTLTQKQLPWGLVHRAVNRSDRAPSMNVLTLCWGCRAALKPLREHDTAPVEIDGKPLSRFGDFKKQIFTQHSFEAVCSSHYSEPLHLRPQHTHAGRHFSCQPPICRAQTINSRQLFFLMLFTSDA